SESDERSEGRDLRTEGSGHFARLRRERPAACNSRSSAATSCATISVQRFVSLPAWDRTSFTAALTRSVGAASTPWISWNRSLAESKACREGVAPGRG